ncbi:hypothetical protein HD806DRAFT_534429 [Xylariaceae sp. AK1471]|nr:hypothetical protein HD806DRAFT_534429 [Xylariaceae sp. AK1471]
MSQVKTKEDWKTVKFDMNLRASSQNIERSFDSHEHEEEPQKQNAAQKNRLSRQREVKLPEPIDARFDVKEVWKEPNPIDWWRETERYWTALHLAAAKAEDRALAFLIENGVLWLITRGVLDHPDDIFENAKGDVRRIMLSEGLAQTHPNFPTLLRNAASIHNRIPNPSSYSSHFLPFGTQPPQQQSAIEISEYVRDPTEEKEIDFRRSIAQNHEAPMARNYFNSLKASKDHIRAIARSRA